MEEEASQRKEIDQRKKIVTAMQNKHVNKSGGSKEIRWQKLNVRDVRSGQRSRIAIPNTLNISVKVVDIRRPSNFKDFAPVAVKQWRSNERRYHIWKCYDCLHPACRKCNIRPVESAPPNAEIDGQYDAFLGASLSKSRSTKSQNNYRYQIALVSKLEPFTIRWFLHWALYLKQTSILVKMSALRQA